MRYTPKPLTPDTLPDHINNRKKELDAKKLTAALPADTADYAVLDMLLKRNLSPTAIGRVMEGDARTMKHWRQLWLEREENKGYRG